MWGRAVPGGIGSKPVRAVVALTWLMKASSIWWLRETSADLRSSGGKSRSWCSDSCSATAMASATGSVIHQCLIGRFASCLPLVDLMAGVP